MSVLPVHNPRLPFSAWIPDRGLQVGSSLKIKASIFDQRIQINLQNGSNTMEISHGNPKDDVMLHISVYPNHRTVLNHFHTKQGWGKEEVIPANSVSKNKFFEIVIKCEVDFYRVTVNGQQSVMTYRLPLNMARYISINGTCIVSYVTFQP